uniref:Uncharacterized protein LOC100177249 n=1 Tax=Phallusia mammillata TaxID=59560 RepID=A0A6F9DHC4_9ASCI|nr:uncharacterized protein LOC100177249 [Phallusia mammillata]
MESRESICKKWLADALSYEALAAFDDKPLMLTLLKSATRKIMQVAKHVGVSTTLSGESIEEATDFYSRILLVVIAVRVCTGLEKRFKYYVNQDQNSLETLLEILEAHSSLFESSAEVYHSMWFATLKELLFKCKEQSKSPTIILDQFKSRLSHEERKSCSDVTQKQIKENYVTYADFMLEQLAFLNTKIRKPFLSQIKSRLGPTETPNLSPDVEDKLIEHKNKINSCMKKWACEDKDGQPVSQTEIIDSKNPTTSKPPKVNKRFNQKMSRMWSVELDSYIVIGVYKFGLGKWSAIKEQYPFPKDKSTVQIKDRWRTMARNHLVEVDQENNIQKLHQYFKDYITTEKDGGTLKLYHCLEQPKIVDENQVSPAVDLVDCVSQQLTSKTDQDFQSPRIKSTGKRKFRHGANTKTKMAKKHFRRIFFEEDDSS